MRPRASVATLLLALSLSACASTSLTRLEQEHEAAPGSFGVNRAVGIAYHRAGQISRGHRV